MTKNDDGKPGAPDTDILSAIRRIVDEEQTGAAPVAPPPAAPTPATGRGAALVLTPTMRVNASADDSDDMPPLRLTKRVDPGAEEDASQARSLRSAFGGDAATPDAAPLRLQPAARVDEAVQTPDPVAPEAPKAPPIRMSGFAGQPVSPGPIAAPEAATDPVAPKPEAPEASKPAAPAPEGPAPVAAASARDASAPIAAGMTREELDALITDKLRQDLSGELGARISANIRTLVQREVSAAVAAAMAKRQP